MGSKAGIGGEVQWDVGGVARSKDSFEGASGDAEAAVGDGQAKDSGPEGRCFGNSGAGESDGGLRKGGGTGIWECGELDLDVATGGHGFGGVPDQVDENAPDVVAGERDREGAVAGRLVDADSEGNGWAD
jgi:hypothetical protein